MLHSDTVAGMAIPESVPRYELRVRVHGAVDTGYEVWQLPAPATPHVRAPVRVAGLRGRNLELIEHRVLRRLARVGVRPGRSLEPQEARIRLGRRTGAYPGVALPSACPDA